MNKFWTQVTTHEKVMYKSVMNNLWENCEKLQTSREQVMKKLWKNVKMLWTSHEQDVNRLSSEPIVKKSWTSCKILKQLWTSHKRVVKNCGKVSWTSSEQVMNKLWKNCEKLQTSH